jgi:hypothetical protein
MSKFSELQSRHEDLIEAQASGDVLDQVQNYVEEVKLGSSQVSSVRERDQLRANLRYWASYIYEKTGTYPNIVLAPSDNHRQKKRIRIFTASGILIVLILLVSFWLLKFKEVRSSSIDEAKIIGILNTELSNTDSLERMLDATYQVTDVSFLPDDSNPSTIRMYVKCTCSYFEQCCIPEQTFVMTIDSLRQFRDDLHIPNTIKDLEIVHLEGNKPITTIYAPWPKVQSFLIGQISSYDLAKSITKRELAYP